MNVKVSPDGSFCMTRLDQMIAFCMARLVQMMAFCMCAFVHSVCLFALKLHDLGAKPIGVLITLSANLEENQGSV